MTKEEIKKVLDLALEYYKLEIFGTGKESQPPTQERIDYIYDHMQQFLPSDLDEAAKKAYKEYDVKTAVKPKEHPVGFLFFDGFKAGAEWMAGQGWEEVSATDYPKPDKDKIYCVYTQKDYPHYLLARVINHPNDDELLQWRCTQFPFTRYDMSEGDVYLEIRKKQ